MLTRLGDKATALLLFQTALQGANEIDIHRLRAECMDGIRESRGEWIEARKLWKAAHSLLIRSSQKTQAATVEAKLVEIEIWIETGPSWTPKRRVDVALTSGRW
ncbi:hypothetical protein B0H14DRAFT_2647656 [Mycena olivaceomarginata]|nr:hypothetical protein B0H14DRAFT_2647656 [Mycena olivaceomarginata]